jgi:hypothetical protein
MQEMELQTSAQNGRVADVERLIAARADLEAKDRNGGWTPLHWAVARGHMEVAEKLLAAGASVGAKDMDGQTPLELAVGQNNPAVAALLREWRPENPVATARRDTAGAAGAMDAGPAELAGIAAAARREAESTRAAAAQAARDSVASERARVIAEARCEAEVIRAAVDRALTEAEAARDSALALQAAARAELARARSEAERLVEEARRAAAAPAPAAAPASAAAPAALSGAGWQGMQIFYHARLAAATGGFAEERKIGAGGFGGVCKAAGLVAGDEGSMQGLPEVLREVQALGARRHPNVLPLFGFSSDGAVCVVTVLMRGGCLEDRMFPLAEGVTRRLGLVRAGARPAALVWALRLRVGAEVAAGLEYLHTPDAAQHRPAILHRDLKPANVLLGVWTSACSVSSRAGRHPVPSVCLSLAGLQGSTEAFMNPTTLRPPPGPVGPALLNLLQLVYEVVPEGHVRPARHCRAVADRPPRRHLAARQNLRRRGCGRGCGRGRRGRGRGRCRRPVLVLVVPEAPRPLLEHHPGPRPVVSLRRLEAPPVRVLTPLTVPAACCCTRRRRRRGRPTTARAVLEPGTALGGSRVVSPSHALLLLGRARLRRARLCRFHVRHCRSRGLLPRLRWRRRLRRLGLSRRPDQGVPALARRGLAQDQHEVRLAEVVPRLRRLHVPRQVQCVAVARRAAGPRACPERKGDAGRPHLDGERARVDVLHAHHRRHRRLVLPEAHRRLPAGYLFHRLLCRECVRRRRCCARARGRHLAEVLDQRPALRGPMRLGRHGRRACACDARCLASLLRHARVAAPRRASRRLALLGRAREEAALHDPLRIGGLT